MIRQTWMRLGFGVLGMFLLAGSLAFPQGAADPAGGEATEPPKSENRTIFDKDVREKLNLTDGQVSELRRLLADLNRSLRIAQAKLILLGYEIEDLIKAEADLATLKSKFQEEAKIRADARFADISASRNINNVLSESQLAAWRAIQAEARAKAGSGDR